MASSNNDPLISAPSGFHFGPVPVVSSPGGNQPEILPSPAQAPLGVLSNFTGTFAGTGFNTIFRPNNAAANIPFPVPVSGNPIPQPPNENVLELNLTTETLSFSAPLGQVPNRGLGNQPDILLNSVPYVQAINAVTNESTGKGDGPAIGIHFEPGLWSHVPETDSDPVLGESITRMASIPHGTTINAQAIEPVGSFAGAPPFDQIVADITPFIIGNPAAKFRFRSQDLINIDTPRIPQDLGLFNTAGTITQPILDNPNLVLKNATANQIITNTIVFTVSTDPASLLADTATAASSSPTLLGGGTTNIAFLEGTNPSPTNPGPDPAANANAAKMNATFWIETVEHILHIPIWEPGHGPLHLTPSGPVSGNPGHIQASSDHAAPPELHLEVPIIPPKPIRTPPHLGSSPTVPVTGSPAPVPHFVFTPPFPIPFPRTIRVFSTQIQYSQTVFLNFAGLTWPHVSVATLVPTGAQSVPGSAWDAN